MEARSVLKTLGAGAATMYFLDPAEGKRRRALVRDKMISGWRRSARGVRAVVEDMSNRMQGVAAKTRHLLKREKEVPDSVLHARVRAQLGRFVSHPGSIHVSAQDGHVTLSGPVLAREVDRLLSRVSRVRGVRSVENRLEIHEHRDNVPGLQGGETPPGAPFELMQTYWSPTARVLVGTAGAALACGRFEIWVRAAHTGNWPDPETCPWSGTPPLPGRSPMSCWNGRPCPDRPSNMRDWSGFAPLTEARRWI